MAPGAAGAVRSALKVLEERYGRSVRHRKHRLPQAPANGERPRMIETLMIALGGAVGSVARYWIGIWALPISRVLPWGTIIINIARSFAISFFGTMTLAGGRYPLSEAARLFFMVGVCGGFTTFSSFSLQTLDLLRGGASARALSNIIASVVLCICSVAAGHAIAAHLNGGTQRITQNIVEEEAS